MGYIRHEFTPGCLKLFLFGNILKYGNRSRNPPFTPMNRCERHPNDHRLFLSCGCNLQQRRTCEPTCESFRILRINAE
ncbi:hypothetical protein D3C74_362730 [compost metagenome]